MERYRSIGIGVDRTMAAALLERTRLMAVRLKRDLTNRELMGIYLDSTGLSKAA
jgi:hypothetical protein